MPHSIEHRIIDLSTSSYGYRIGFGNNDLKVNPRKEIGKFGIACH